MNRQDPSARRPLWPRRAMAALGAAALTAAAVTAGVTSMLPPATADEAASIQTTGQTPAVLTGSDQLLLTGTVTAGDKPLTDVRIQLRVSSRAIATRSALAALVATPSVARAGTVVTGATVDLAERLPAGEAVPFRLEVAADALPFDDPGAYVGAVEIRAADESGRRTRVAFGQLLLPFWVPGSVSAPTPIAMLWPLLETPQVDAEGVLLSDEVITAFAPGGRLDRLLTEAGDAPVSLVVDPDLLQTAAMIADGARVRLEDGSIEARPPDPVVADWLRRATERLQQEGSVAVGFADPDMTALVRAGRSTQVAAALDAGSTAAGDLMADAPPTEPIWPAGGADAATLTTLAGLGAESVVLPASQYPSDNDGVATGSALVQLPEATGSLQGLLADDQLASAFSRGGSAAAGVATRQQLLADTLLIVRERSSDPRPQLLTPPRRWDPAAGSAADLIAALSAAPWLDTVPLSEFRSLPADDSDRRAFRYRGAEAELPAAVPAAAAPAEQAIDGLSQVLTDPAPVIAPLAEAVLRSGSAAWRGDIPAGTQYAAATGTTGAATAAKLRLAPRDEVSLTGQSGTIPLTVINDLPGAATVRVTVTATPSVRLTVSDPGEVTVAAGRRLSVEIPAEASASGTVLVESQLSTTAGEPYGPPQQFRVQVRALGQVQGWLVITGLAVLAGFTLVRVILAARKNRTAA